MSAMSDYLELKLLDHITGRTAYTKPSAVYLALYTADPTDTGGGATELSGSGYARVAVAFDAAASGATSNTSNIDFAAATGNWGGGSAISHWALYDASTSGNMLIHGSFTTSKVIETNDVLRISAGDLDLTAS